MMLGFMERIDQIRQELGQTAGIDPLSDRYRVGAIAAYTDVLNVDVNEISEVSRD